MDCPVFRYAHTLRDLGAMRAGVIALLAVGVAVLAMLLILFGVDKVSAGFMAVAIFTLPGPQYMAFMTGFSFTLELSISLIAYFVISHRSESKSIQFFSLAACVGLLVISMLIYQAWAFVFFWGTLSVLLFERSISNRNAIIMAMRDIAIFAGASLIYLSIYKSRYGYGFIPDSYRADLSISNAVHKIPSLFIEVLPRAASLWQMSTGPFLSTLVVLILSSCIFWMLAGYRDRGYSNENCLSASDRIFSSIRGLMLVLILVCVCGPWLLANPPGFPTRTLFPISGAIMMVVLGILPGLIGCLLHQPFKLQKLMQQTVILCVAIVGLLMSSHNTSLSVWNTNTEMQFARTEIAEHGTWPRRIHIVRTINNGVGFNGLYSIGDEFNRRTTDFPQNIFDFVHIALMGIKGGEDVSMSLCDIKITNCEMAVPKTSIILTTSDYGEATCKSENMVLIDLNALVRATGTGEPSVLQAAVLEPCGSGKPWTSSKNPPPTLLVEGYRGFNIIGYQNRIYAILQNEGAFSIDKINNNSYSRSIVGTSVAEVKQAIDRYEGNSYYPQPVILVENYHGLNIIGAQNHVYAVPLGEGTLNILFAGTSLKEVMQQIDNASVKK
jgi:hypothetical protein